MWGYSLAIRIANIRASVATNRALDTTHDERQILPLGLLPLAVYVCSCSMVVILLTVVQFTRIYVG